jgi:hypothetical protein
MKEEVRREKLEFWRALGVYFETWNAGRAYVQSARKLDFQGIILLKKNPWNESTSSWTWCIAGAPCTRGGNARARGGGSSEND